MNLGQMPGWQRFTALLCVVVVGSTVIRTMSPGRGDSPPFGPQVTTADTAAVPRLVAESALPSLRAILVPVVALVLPSLEASPDLHVQGRCRRQSVAVSTFSLPGHTHHGVVSRGQYSLRL